LRRAGNGLAHFRTRPGGADYQGGLASHCRRRPGPATHGARTMPAAIA